LAVAVAAAVFWSVLWGRQAPVAAGGGDVVRVTDVGTAAAGADLARDADGTLHAVYYATGAGGDYDLWYVASGDDGLTWSEPRALTTDSCRDWFPSILAGPGERLWVFWSSDRAGADEFDIWMQASDDRGATWGEPTRLTDVALWDYAPSAMLDADGRLWVVYYSYRQQDWDIWYQVSDDDGATWAAAVRLTGSGNWEYNPDILQLQNGTIWVTWYAGKSATSDVWACYSSDGGSNWSTPANLSGHDSANVRPSLAQGTDGTLWLFWQSNRTGQADIYYRYSMTNGASWSAATRYTLFTGPDEDVSAAALSAGRIGLLWASDRAVSQDLWFGVPGDRDDLDPPPHYEYSAYTPDWVTDEDEIIITAQATDDDRWPGSGCNGR
jgi:predicted neuraminidase